MWEGELGLGEGPSGSLNEEQSSECLLRVAMLTLNFWLLLIKVEGLEIPDVGSLAWVCVYVCLEFLEGGGVRLWESTDPHSRGRQVREVGRGRRKITFPCLFKPH